MQALATISMPIAVQSEKLQEDRYSLFDYIVRAVVKACVSCPTWQDASGGVDVLLFENCGEKMATISNAAQKTIFRLAKETHRQHPVPEGFSPHIVVCDAQTTRAQVASHLAADRRPGFAFVVRGHSPKVGIRAGIEEVQNYTLSYTFYAATTLPAADANRIAARLHALLYNPVRLLLLD